MKPILNSFCHTGRYHFLLLYIIQYYFLEEFRSTPFSRPDVLPPGQRNQFIVCNHWEQRMRHVPPFKLRATAYSVRCSESIVSCQRPSWTAYYYLCGGMDCTHHHVSHIRQLHIRLTLCGQLSYYSLHPYWPITQRVLKFCYLVFETETLSLRFIRSKNYWCRILFP